MGKPGKQPLVDQEDGNRELYILNLALTITSSLTLNKSLSLSESKLSLDLTLAIWSFFMVDSGRQLEMDELEVVEGLYLFPSNMAK